MGYFSRELERFTFRFRVAPAPSIPRERRLRVEVGSGIGSPQPFWSVVSVEIVLQYSFWRVTVLCEKYLGSLHKVVKPKKYVWPSTSTGLLEKSAFKVANPAWLLILKLQLVLVFPKGEPNVADKIPSLVGQPPLLVN